MNLRILRKIVVTLGVVIVVLLAILLFVDVPEKTGMPSPDGDEAFSTGKEHLIRVTSPEPHEVVQNSFMVTGEARGVWFFEANFPVVLVDWDGRIIAETFATAEGEWMTEDFVPFTATVDFSLSADNATYLRGALILRKANASGLPEHDDAIEIPVSF